MKITSFLQILVFACLALPIHAQECCEQPCAAFTQPCRSSCRSICCDGSTVGAIFLGAGAGALAGWAASSGGGHHCSKRCQFDKDKKETLDLTYTLSMDGGVTALPAIQASVTPFATLPNERIIVGETQPITIPSGSGTTSVDIPIHISEVLFGKYQLGVLIEYPEGFNPSSIDVMVLQVEVDSSRYGISFVFAEMTAGLGFFDEEAPSQELIADYTYYPVQK